jgi:subtilisin-like proprotein convertase family protein
VGEGGTIIHTAKGGFSRDYGSFWADWIGLRIFDNQETKSTIEINVSDDLRDEYYLAGVEVFIDSIMHSRVSDLEILLTHNDVTRTLVYHVSDQGENFLWTKLTDEATHLINDGTAPFSGDHKPYQPLSAFSGMNPNGEWTLTIFDSEAGHEGTLDAWGIKPMFEKIVTVNESTVLEGLPKIEYLENIPNPFTEKTLIKWKCNEGGYASLNIYDINGQEIAKLLNKYMSEGEYSFEFDGKFLNPGFYLCRFTFSDNTIVKKIVKL